MGKPSGTSRSTFQGLHLVAGHPALDLVNTVKYRGQPDPQDTLDSFASVVEWAHVAGLIDTAEKLALLPRDAPEIWHKIIALREALWTVLNHEQVAAQMASQARRLIEKAISGLRYMAVIDPHTGALQRIIKVRDPEDVLARIINAVADLLSRRHDLLIKTCDGCDCDWLFIDRTRAGRRRWCDTATCGNLARVRAHRKKHKILEQEHAG